MTAGRRSAPTSAAGPAPLPRRHENDRPRHVLRAVAIAVVGGLVLGGLTSPAQQYLPDSLRSFANSSGGWTALTFLLVWFGRSRPIASAVLGVVTFVLLVEGYRIASDWRGFHGGAPFQSFFTFAGLLAGPIVGLGAAFIRSRSSTWRTLAVTPLAAVLIGEGVYGITVITTTSPVYWWLQIAGGVAATAATLVRARPRLPWLVVSLLLIAGGATTFWFVYQSLGSP